MSQAGPLNESGGTGGGGIAEIVTNSGTASPIAGTIEILGGTDITTSAAGNVVTITFTGTTGAFTWNVVTSANNIVQLVASNGYICSGVSQVIFLLPLAPTVGDEFKIVSYTSKFQITQNGGQQMRLGTQITTAGSGTVTSNSAGDTVDFVYVGGNVFLELDMQGTLTVV